VWLDRYIHGSGHPVGSDHRAAVVELDGVVVAGAAKEVDPHEVGDVRQRGRADTSATKAFLRDPTILQDNDSVGERDSVEELVGDEDAAARERSEVNAKFTAEFGSGADVERASGSSSRSSRGAMTSARASATRCC